MAYSFSKADVDYLTSARGTAAVAELAALPLTEQHRIADVRAARTLAGDHAGAALETAVLRRRSAAKLPHAAGWLFTDEALQQASPGPVAAHRATRLSGMDVHDVTCSIGADLVELAGTAARCLGSDVDDVRLAMARHNTGGRIPLLRADALRPVSTDTVVFADPGRRDASGGRVWRAAALRPPLDELRAAYPGRPLVVKTAPGMNPAAAPWAAEVELVSLDGMVREACLWSEPLAGARRRASVLRSDGTGYSLTDGEPDECPVREAGEWLIDPDGAVVRAGLVRHYAARHGLAQLDRRIAYLTGDVPPAGQRAFRVLARCRYAEKPLRALLREHDVGSLEILVRGVDVAPEVLRRRLKPAGTRSASLIVTRIGSQATTFLCEPNR